MIYKGITSFRNYLFDKGILKEFTPEVFSIGVGNLTVGGTGKTPMVDYLISILNDIKLGVISRGYGRKTKGFYKINNSSTAQTVGDEPLMLARRNPEINFFVSESRVKGFQEAHSIHPEIGLFIFDDVFQHRYLKPHVNILLCDYNQPFFSDSLLPFGRLRESRNGAARADVIVVTKTPKELKNSEKIYFEEKIRTYSKINVPIFFAEYEPGKPVNNYNNELSNGSEVVLISALANNQIFKEQQAKYYTILEHYQFRDHHSFTEKDIQTIFLKHPQVPIVTTEKDMIKIRDLIPTNKLSHFFVVKIMVKTSIDFTNYIKEKISFV